MRNANLGIAPEGFPFIGLSGFTSLVAAILGWWPVALFFWLLCVFSVYFFRDPERVVPVGDGIATSPADGKIIRIEERPDPFSGEQRQCISIFMNVFNVHVNRAPIASTVMDIDYFEGKFFNASLDKASSDNERCAWKLQDSTRGNMWTMVQIAGLVARRIVCRAEPGDRLRRGQRMGIIRFGSRVDLYLPDTYAPAVKLGDKVIAGQSVIAKRTSQ